MDLRGILIIGWRAGRLDVVRVKLNKACDHSVTGNVFLQHVSACLALVMPFQHLS